MSQPQEDLDHCANSPEETPSFTCSRGVVSEPLSAPVSRSPALQYNTKPAVHATLHGSLPDSTLCCSTSASGSRSLLRDERKLLANDGSRMPFPSNGRASATPTSVSCSMIRGEKMSVVDDAVHASVSSNTFPTAASESISRSSLLGENKPLVDDAVRASTSSSGLKSTASASVSRSSRMSEKKPSADGGLQRSIAAARGIPSRQSLMSLSTTSHLYSSMLSSQLRRGFVEHRPSATVDSVKMRKIQLQEEINRVYSQTGRRKTAGLFRESCSTDLLFLLDTTFSMKPYLNAAKQQIREIASEIKAAFLSEAHVRIAVVSYKDHDDQPQIQFLDFTSSVDTVHSFLDELKATGGDDIPEDVLGGVQQSLNASWKQQTRCIVHIADAPPHGSSMHDLGVDVDRYYRDGSEPHGLIYQPIFRLLVDLNINYAFLRINSSTDRMAFNVAGIYGYDNAKLLATNTFYHKANSADAKSSGGTLEKSIAEARPRFDEQALGTTYSRLRHLVVSAVTASVSRTAGRLSVAVAREAPLTKLKSTSALSAIRESDDGGSVKRAKRGATSRTSPALETSPPQWATSGWLDETLEVSGFCPAIVVHDADTLSNMMFADENIKLAVTEFTVYARSKPFAKGAVRLASYARTAASTSRFVMKSFIQAGHTRAHVAEDMRMQALCKAFALEFNSLLKVEPPLDFIVTSCLQKDSASASGLQGECLSLEPFLEGKYVKYNNNADWVLDEEGSFNQMAQAFSHFSFERSYGRFLVNDLQGVGRTLTDPSIQTSSLDRFMLNDTNLGEEGFKFFFRSHKCNPYCEELKLESNGKMFETGHQKFREHWPMMDPTVCCSNMLCRRIIRLADAHSCDKFPGHKWCDACWSQLEDSEVRSLCVEPGESHEFNVSRFFHESQGELTPQKCSEHREKTASDHSASAIGGSLYSTLKATESRGSISGRGW